MTVIEMQVMTVVRNTLPDMFKTLMRIANALEEANSLIRIALKHDSNIEWGEVEEKKGE